MIADQHIRDQVLDIHQSFLVQAPAGSGKTSLLVQRYLSLLANAQQAPEEILAITFTRKAAAEMRHRIIAALQLGQNPQAPDNPYELKLWQLARAVLQRDLQAGWDLLDNPARMKIQTIDALSSSIARQMPILSQFGALPNIEPKAEALYLQAMEQFLQSGLSSNEQQELNKLLLHLDNDREKLKELLISMLQIRDQWLPVVMHNLHEHELRDYLENSLQLTVNTVLEDLNNNIPEQLNIDLLPLDYADDLTMWQQITEILLTKEGEWRQTVTAQQGFPAPSAAKNKQEKEQLKANKDAVLQMLRNLNSCEDFKLKLNTLTRLPPIKYTADQWQVLNSILKLLPMAVAHLTMAFKDTGKVDFAAVSLAALQALGNEHAPSDLMLALDCKIRHILIDEFQDTSITQFNLLEKITANWDVYDGKTLFLVGDPMQSIYRFRKAEVGLFLQAQQHGIGNIKLNYACLTVNFRSYAPVIAWVNRVFAAAFPIIDDITYGAIKYMPATAAKEDQQDSAIFCQAVNDQQQSTAIVTIINQAKQINPNATIAVLVRAKSHLIDLLPVLREHNIPYQALEIELLSQRPVIQDLLALTRAILHLDDRIAWLAILRAPWCGLQLDDLEILANATQPLWEVLQQPEIISKLSNDAQIRISHLVKVLQAVLEQTGRQTIDIQVQTAWKNLGGKSCIANENALFEAETYFDFLSNLAHEINIYEPGYLEQQLDNLFLKPRFADNNSVQIMTMHKAKGLEFDVVILPGLHKKTTNDEQRLLLIENRHHPMRHLLMAPIKSAADQADPIYKFLAWNECQRQDYETLRLLYVAATRAKKQLYCLANLGENKPAENSLLGKIWPQIANEFVRIDEDEVENSSVAIKAIARLPIGWYQNNTFEPEIITIAEERPEILLNDDKMRLIGTVVHRIFYQIANESLDAWNNARILEQQTRWRQHLTQVGLFAHEHEQALDIIKRAVTNALQDERGRVILSANHLQSYAEWRLTTTHKFKQFSQIVLDRAYLDHDLVFWIVDYKVVGDHHDLEQEVEKYKPQLYKYIAAVRKLMPEKNIKAGLYFPLQKAWKSI